MVSVEGPVVEFRFYRPSARQVWLAGDFNGWRNQELPMHQDEQGYWMARLRLPAGSYRFRYWADGAWFPDYAAFGLEAGPFGFDSVVRVAPVLGAAHVFEQTPRAGISVA
jgi:1,4-alpha-glucan branching enzyme